MNIQNIQINKIKPNPSQARKVFDSAEIDILAKSIKQYGLLQPILVIEKNDQYMVVAGERRFRACKQLGFGQIHCQILDSKVQPEDNAVIEMCLIENVQRKDLNALEEAMGYASLIKRGLTQVEIAERIGKSRSHIANIMRLLQLPEIVQRRLVAGELTSGHAMTLLNMPNLTESLLEQIVQKKVSVHQLRQDVKKVGANPTKHVKKEVAKLTKQVSQDECLAQSDINMLEKQLTKVLQVDVLIDQEAGCLELQYGNMAGLDDLLEKLMRG